MFILLDTGSIDLGFRCFYFIGFKVEFRVLFFVDFFFMGFVFYGFFFVG